MKSPVSRELEKSDEVHPDAELGAHGDVISNSTSLSFFHNPASTCSRSRIPINFQISYRSLNRRMLETLPRNYYHPFYVLFLVSLAVV